MPIVVCLIEKKLYSSAQSGSPRSGPSFHLRDVCDANIEGDCHAPPVGQLFSGISSYADNVRNSPKLVDFNQINSIFLELFANLHYLNFFYRTLIRIVASDYMKLLSTSVRNTYIAHINEFKKNIERLNLLNDLCRKDVENLDVPEMWKLLLYNKSLWDQRQQMIVPEKIDASVNDSRRHLDELYAILTMEEKRKLIYPLPAGQKNFLSDTKAEIQHDRLVTDTKYFIKNMRKKSVKADFNTMRTRIEYHEKKEFPPNHNYSKVLTFTLSAGDSFIESSRGRVKEVIEWYFLILEIELQFFEAFHLMHEKIETELEDVLRSIRRTIIINDERIARTSSESISSDESLISDAEIFLEPSEKQLLMAFIEKYREIFSLASFDQLKGEFLAQDFYKRSPSVDDMVRISNQTPAQSIRTDEIFEQISNEKKFHDSLVESKATIALCQFYNKKHTLSGKNLHCCLYSDMNRIFYKYLPPVLSTPEQVLFLQSKYLFPISLIEHLKYAKTIVCGSSAGIRGFISLHVKDLLSQLKRAISAKKEGFLISQSLKRSCEEDIAFLNRVDEKRREITTQLRDLNERASSILFEDETDYLRRCQLFALSEPDNKRDEKAFLMVSHANYINSNLLFLCLHYLNYAWGYATQRGRPDIASPHLICVDDENIEDFSKKITDVFTDVSKSVIQILFVFKKIHFIGACLRSFNLPNEQTLRGLESMRKFVLLESGDLVVIPRQYILKIKELCQFYNIEFDDQIAESRQIGANCGFIALETMAFLSQPNLFKVDFSASKVSGYIAQATGATRNIEIMRPGVPNDILSEQGQIYASAVANYITEGRIRLRLRWAKFAQQAYKDSGFKNYIEQSLSNLLDFDGVLLDPDLESYDAGISSSVFWDRMQVDCFSLPVISSPNPVYFSASSSSSSSSSSLPNHSLSRRMSAPASSSVSVLSSINAHGRVLFGSSLHASLQQDDYFSTPRGPSIRGSFDSTLSSPQSPITTPLTMQRSTTVPINPFSPDSVLSPITPTDTQRRLSSASATSPHTRRPTFSSGSPLSPLTPPQRVDQLPGSPRTAQLEEADIPPISSPRTPVTLQPAEPIVAQRKEKKRVTWSEWWSGKKPPTT